MLPLRGGLPSWSLRQLKNLMFSMAGFRTDTKLEFGYSGGMAEGVGPWGGQEEAAFPAIASASRCSQTLLAPNCPTHSGERIAEGGLRFGVPRRRGSLLTFARRQVGGQESHDREQRQEARCGAGDGFVGPLALRLDAQMRPRLLEGGLDLPALHEPA